MYQRFAGLMLPLDDVELPAVPGAGDDAALELSFAERASLMRADAVEGVDDAINVEKGNDSVARNAFFGGSGRKLAFRSGEMPGGHPSIVTGASERGQPCRRRR